MSDQPEPTVTSITDPSMEETHFGIAVASLGEDGDVIALGHHDDDKARAAFRAFNALPFDLADTLRGWAYFRTPQPDSNPWEAEWMWIAEECTAETPGAVPVTFFR